MNAINIVEDRTIKWTKQLILAGVLTTIGSALVVGFNIGVINAPQEVILKFCNESMHTRYGAVLNKRELDILWSTVVSIFLVGGCTGSLTGSLLANRIGRKGAITASSLFAAVAAILFYSSRDANSVEMLVAARLLVGLSAGLTTCVMPMYLTELAPLELRGSMGVLCPLGVTFGVLVGQVMSLGQILGTEHFWPFLLSIYLIPVLICAAGIAIIPESPKYLFVIRKQPNLALKQLSRLRELPEEFLEHELQELRREEQDCTQNQEDSWSLGRVLKDKELLLPLLLVCSLQAGQQLSGINAVFYYSVSVFKSAGFSDQDSELANIGAGVCNFLMAVISIPVMARYNRRITLMLSLTTTSFFLFILGLAILLIDEVHWMSYISIVGVLGFVICYGIGLGPIPYFIGSELFQVGPQLPAMAIGSLANWGGNFFVGITFPTLKNYIGATSFFIFGILTVALTFFIRYYLPETRNKDVTEIAHLCRRGLSSRPLSESSSSISTTESIPTADTKSV